MADVDNRKPLKVFHIRYRRNNIPIIRNKFRMDAGFFAHGHNMPQLFIVAKAQRNGDLIQGTVLFQDVVQIVDAADDLNAAVLASSLHPVIQMPRIW